MAKFLLFFNAFLIIRLYNRQCAVLSIKSSAIRQAGVLSMKKKKAVTIVLALMLSLNASIGMAAAAAGQGSASSTTPTTTSRTGTFSTGGSSSTHSTPPSHSSTGGFSGGSSSSTAPGSSNSSSSGAQSPSAGSSNSSNGPAVNSSGSSGFSGGASNKSTVPSAPSSNSSITKNGTTYSTGTQRPSSNVQNGSTTNPATGRSYYGGSTYSEAVPNGKKKPSSFWPVAGAFAAGTFLGSMLHPQGGYFPAAGGGYVHQPFSIMPLLIDIGILIFVIWIGSLLFKSLRGRRG